MTPDANDPHERQRLFRAIDAAFRAGDVQALAAALGHAPRWVDRPMPAALGMGHPLAYAIHWSPPAFIEALIAAGSSPTYAADDGFPALIATLTSARADRLDVLRLLIRHGADVNSRGINDWTPLHVAVSQRDDAAIRLLLEAGADVTLRTRIDDGGTALDDATAAGFDEGVALLGEALAKRRPGQAHD